jgi:hypothetical protein
MKDLHKLILGAVGQLFFDWLGFKLLDTTVEFLQSPSWTSALRGIIGIVAIILATILACYLVSHAWRWWKIDRHIVKTSREQVKPVTPLGGAQAEVNVPDVNLGKEKPECDLGQIDDSFKALQEVTQPETKKIELQKFQPKLHSLCYDYNWSDEVKDRVMKVLDYIPEETSNDPNIDYYLLYLGMILHRYREYTISAVRAKFLVELENLYNNPKFETNAQILNLLQELNEFSEPYMVKLIDDACSISRWSDQRFQSLEGSIQWWELKKDKEVHKRVLQYMRRKMDDAAKNKDEKTRDRLEKLYKQAGQ